MNERIILEAEKNGNLITTSKVMELGFSKTLLSKYVANGNLIRVCSGIYALPNTVIDDTYVLQLRNDKIIFSHETALFLNGISERTPFTHSFTVPTGYILPESMKNNTVHFYIKDDFFELGLCTRKTTFGNPVRCYNPERTICDILRSRSRMDEETVISGIKKYASSKEKDLFLLYEYAKQLKVLAQVKKYMEVLI
ncbi:MAG: type IV toxin-antitoxin system AbiEi family antitoxin domain-containing protein [Treponema sp.]|nr:type IV toxin-antitoxin system AbiEi family antitoxin domain-containing protein [Treponema sp.]